MNKAQQKLYDRLSQKQKRTFRFVAALFPAKKFDSTYAVAVRAGEGFQFICKGDYPITTRNGM